MISSSPINQSENFGLGRFLMLGMMSVLLTSSFILSIFAPYPLGLSQILYGRVKGGILAALAICVCFLLIQIQIWDVFVLAIFLFNIMISFFVSEIVAREWDPVKGIMGAGVLITTLMISFVFFTLSGKDLSLKEFLITEIERVKPELDDLKKKMQTTEGESNIEFEQMLAKPELLADEVIRQVPSLFIIGSILMLWVNLFFLLKSNRLIAKMNQVKYSEKTLLDFKMPDFAVWIVITALVGVLFGAEYGEWIPVIGETVLKVLGIFYFFQGFGIYLAFLDYVKLTGFLRSFVVVITIFTAGQVLAVIGLVDMFVNFKKLMQKRKQD